MKTKFEVEDEIIKISTKISSELPGLAKHTLERPVVETEKIGINLQNMDDYYQSLYEMLTRYSKRHIETDFLSEK